MRPVRPIFTAAIIPGLLLVAASCSKDSTAPDGADQALLLSISPAGGAIDVDPNGVVVVRFNHSMMDEMDEYAVVQEGDLNGPVVPGSWSWSEQQTVLTFTPAAPLKPATDYVIHLGGGMMDEDGHTVNFQQYGMGMGGHWATAGMMNGGGMMNGPGPMGPGWLGANGDYGMFFTFRTAG